MRIRVVRGLIMGLLLLPFTGGAETLIEAGIWNVETSQQVNGQPKTEPVIYTQCIENLQKLAAVLKPEANCSVYNILASFNKISWDIHCASNTNSSDGRAKLLKSKGKITGKIEMRVSIPGVSFTMPTVRKIRATLISDCKP